MIIDAKPHMLYAILVAMEKYDITPLDIMDAYLSRSVRPVNHRLTEALTPDLEHAKQVATARLERMHHAEAAER